MKEFFKWLGVNDKVAKVAIWVLIIMGFLIMTNAMLESIGAPYYRVTIENLSKINYSKVLDIVISWITSLISFLAITLLVFRISDFKKILINGIAYVVILTIFVQLFDTNQFWFVGQLFMAIYMCCFCYLKSNKNWKYILYCLGSLAFNILLQYISYTYKLQFIDYSLTNTIERLVLSLDYYIIVFLIIIGKEIYIKKRRG